MSRLIIVGRNPECDIRLGRECIYASGNHARIFVNGAQIVYQDTSRNGTYINGRLLRNQSVAITAQDRILLAGKYPLEWHQIIPYFQGNSTMYEGVRSEQTRFETNQEVHPFYQQTPNLDELPKFGWNWGAFSLYPLWGFWNGCWWSILISLFFGWSIIPNILYGAMGSKWSWNNKTWNNAAEFNQAQEDWKPWGIAVFIMYIISIILVWIFWSSFWSSFYLALIESL